MQPHSTCSVDGCDRPHCARTWCRMHYKRWYRQHGPIGRQSAGDRFWSKVEKTAGCWLWQASCDTGGYGQFSVNSAPVKAYRWAYESLVGPVPGGLTLDHLCRVRACVKPAHLEPVTFAENVRRGVGATAINARKTHCKRGHEFTSKNTYHPPYRPTHRRCRECAHAYKRANRVPARRPGALACGAGVALLRRRHGFTMQVRLEGVSNA